MAITRSRHCLWIVGNAKTLSTRTIWAELIADARSRGCFLDGRSDMGMRRVMRRRQVEGVEVQEVLQKGSYFLDGTIWKVCTIPPSPCWHLHG